MTSELKQKIGALRKGTASLRHFIEWAIAFDEALGIAIEERTGRPSQPGDPFTEADYERAKRIVTALQSEVKQVRPF